MVQVGAELLTSHSMLITGVFQYQIYNIAKIKFLTQLPKEKDIEASDFFNYEQRHNVHGLLILISALLTSKTTEAFPAGPAVSITA